MGCGTCQLGPTAGVEVGEKESRGSISGGRERRWAKGRSVDTIAMRELRQGFWAPHAMREVQSDGLLYALVSGRSLQRAQGRMSSHKYSFKEWFGDEIERSSTNPLLVPPIFTLVFQERNIIKEYTACIKYLLPYLHAYMYWIRLSCGHTQGEEQSDNIESSGRKCLVYGRSKYINGNR